MWKSLSILLIFTTLPAFAEEKLNLGREALPEEIQAWDIEISPDGSELPEGEGDAFTGEEAFATHCASCHGDFAEGVDNWPVLAGGMGTLADKDPVKTVGSYWPYLSTVWDYVNRSMPFHGAQTLSNDEVYAITAYILYSNDLIDDDFVLNKDTFLEVEMPNANGFVIDDRPQTEYAIWSSEPCMENCKDNVEITMHASVLDVTPDEGNADDNSTDSSVEETGMSEEVASVDSALVAEGEKIFKKCKSCHAVGEGAKNGSGPQLNNIVDANFAASEGFRYSKPFMEANAEGRVWTEEELRSFIANPREYIKGTKMSFAGLKDEEDIEAVIAYLKTFNE